jgi:hypothetical protein
MIVLRQRRTNTRPLAWVKITSVCTIVPSWTEENRAESPISRAASSATDADRDNVLSKLVVRCLASRQSTVWDAVVRTRHW